MCKQPLISCLCVTRNRVHLIKRVIDCFKSQSYQNKELILVYEDCDINIREFAQTISDDRIKVIEVRSNPKKSLGELRNISIENASGEYFCQWDADDWYHCHRLELQMDYIQKMCKPICMLTYWIIFDSFTKKAYLSRKRLWEGSILCKKEVVKNVVKYPSLEKKEDFYFVEELLKSNIIYPADLPYLYIYVYHGENTWDYDHFKLNFKTGKELTSCSSELIGNILDGNYTNEEASELMHSPAILEGLEYQYEFY